MNHGFWKLFLIAAFALPSPALAQCGMMSEGGHQHGSAGAHDHGSGTNEKSLRKARKVDPKASKSAKKLLDDAKGRDALLEAILNDRDFVKSLVEEFAADPEWSALMAADLKAIRLSPTRGATDSEAPAVQDEYQCPMHPEVRSDKPGKCPKCGMTLERVRAEGE